MTTHLPADLGDPVLVAWILAWDAEAFRHGAARIFDAPSFFPYLHTLVYSEHMFGVALFTAPLQWLTAKPVLVHNIAFIASFVQAGAGMYVLARALTGRRDAALLAALAYAFAPHRVAQFAHLPWLMTGWLPLSLWALHRYFSTGALRYLLACAARVRAAKPHRKLLHLLRAAAAGGGGGGGNVARETAAAANRRSPGGGRAGLRARAGAGGIRVLRSAQRARLSTVAIRDRRVQRRPQRLFPRPQSLDVVALCAMGQRRTRALSRRHRPAPGCDVAARQAARLDDIRANLRARSPR